MKLLPFTLQTARPLSSANDHVVLFAGSLERDANTVSSIKKVLRCLILHFTKEVFSFDYPSCTELGHVLHTCEGDLVCKCTNEKIPYFNAPVYLENKSQIGKVDDIFGPMTDFVSLYFNRDRCNLSHDHSQCGNLSLLNCWCICCK